MKKMMANWAKIFDQAFQSLAASTFAVLTWRGRSCTMDSRCSPYQAHQTLEITETNAQVPSLANKTYEVFFAEPPQSAGMETGEVWVPTEKISEILEGFPDFIAGPFLREMDLGGWVKVWGYRRAFHSYDEHGNARFHLLPQEGTGLVQYTAGPCRSPIRDLERAELEAIFADTGWRIYTCAAEFHDKTEDVSEDFEELGDGR